MKSLVTGILLTLASLFTLQANDAGIRGTRDTIVPMWCSECYKTAYGGRAALEVVEGENHTITRRRSEVVRLVVEFFK